MVTSPVQPNIRSVTTQARENIRLHIEHAFIPSEMQHLLLDDLNRESNPFYFCYASLFSIAAPESIREINIAGYFYFRYLLVTDQLVDSKSEGTNLMKHLSLSNFYHEECIRLLTARFIHLPDFWKSWAKRKGEHLSAFVTDKKFLTTLSLEESETLADHKSANGKVAIDSLFITGSVSGDEYKTLLLSHKYFSCGFQYYDDVIDLKEDIVNRQTNIALCELRKTYTESEFEHAIQDPDRMVRIMHVRGVAAGLLRRALIYFERAAELVSEMDCPFWKQAIGKKQAEVRAVLQHVEYYVEALCIKVRLSDKKRISLGPLSVAALADSINQAVGFIGREQETDGRWKDSPVNTWLSGYWTTGYVLQALDRSKLPVHGVKVDEAVAYLRSRSTSCWPYIENWVEDADSSNFALLGLLNHGIEEVPALTELLTYQQPDGGFSTYKNNRQLLDHLQDPNITDVSGWTQSHVCVSAGTLCLLARINGYEQEKERLVQFILSRVSGKHLWSSYWWTSDLYSTCLIIEAAAMLNHPALNAIIPQTAVAVMKLQQHNGLFADAFNSSHIFYSSLVLKAFSSHKQLANHYWQELDALADAIRLLQNEDGSWDSSFALRVPAANCLNPEEVRVWEKTDLGQNVIIEDIHRLITTASVVSALGAFSEHQHVG